VETLLYLGREGENHSRERIEETLLQVIALLITLVNINMMKVKGRALDQGECVFLCEGASLPFIP
jgi:hypothetical protein